MLEQELLTRSQDFKIHVSEVIFECMDILFSSSLLYKKTTSSSFKNLLFEICSITISIIPVSNLLTLKFVSMYKWLFSLSLSRLINLFPLFKNKHTLSSWVLLQQFSLRKLMLTKLSGFSFISYIFYFCLICISNIRVFVILPYLCYLT